MQKPNITGNATTAANFSFMLHANNKLQVPCLSIPLHSRLDFELAAFVQSEMYIVDGETNGFSPKFERKVV